MTSDTVMSFMALYYAKYDVNPMNSVGDIWQNQWIIGIQVTMTYKSYEVICNVRLNHYFDGFLLNSARDMSKSLNHEM